MRSNYISFYENVLRYEGYYCNDPDDPGGETIFGVSRVYNPSWEGWKVWDRINANTCPSRDVAEIKLQMYLMTFYKEEYWDRVQGDSLPAGIDMLLGDMAVNMGVSRSSKIMQKLVGAIQDGLIGEKTLQAIHLKAPEELLQGLFIERILYYISLNKDKYIKGWITRSAKCYTLCINSLKAIRPL